jgi:uncharacterized protein YbjT (DUF2867 family)
LEEYVVIVNSTKSSKLQQPFTMQHLSAVLLGASGLVGSHVLELLLREDRFSAVRILVRKPLPLNHPKLEQIIVDFNDFDAYRNSLGTGDCIFCCIGTTNARVKGDRLVYRSIDFDIPVNAARFGKEAGFRQFLLVSAIGANPSSRFFYPRLKGEVESVIASFRLPCFHVFRPSFLLGNRKEHRSGERLGQWFASLLHPLIPLKYRSIQAKQVARAMVIAALKQQEGTYLHHYKEMIQTNSGIG